jgi:phage shock protein PspC (stress-responsive transcriptional regulator)
MSDVLTKRCAYCAEEIRAEAVKCRYCGSSVSGRALSRTWYRSRTQRRIAGVCGGLADEFGISVTVLRLAFVLAALMSWGVGVVVYLALWVVMPYRPGVPRLADPREPAALPDAPVRPVDDRRVGRFPADPGASSS